MFQRALAVSATAVVCVVILGGCGGDSSTDTAAPKATSKPEKVLVEITAPGTGDEITETKTEVRGTVQPPDAEVVVAGENATVDNGLFRAEVPLDRGNNTIDVVAITAGAAPATSTVEVTRGPSEKEQAAVRARSRRREGQARRREAQAKARRERAAAARRARANAPVAVPDLFGERLDVAKDTLREKRLRSSVIGGGTFSVINESAWVVCETRPGAGAEVKKGSRVKLIVDRDC